MGYKMKGSPHKMGTIQGTSGHASALKQIEDERTNKEIKDAVERQELLEKERLNTDLINKNATTRTKTAQDETWQTFKKGKGYRGEDKMYDTDAIEKLRETNPDLADRAIKKNTQRTAKTTKAAEAKAKGKAKYEESTSEKTKRLREVVEGSDIKTEMLRKEETKALDKEGKYGKGLFKGKLRRKRAGKQYEKQQKKEDASRKKLGKSEAYDQLSPAEKTNHDRERKAFITAMFTDDASTMHQIAKKGVNKKKQNEQLESPKNDVKENKDFKDKVIKYKPPHIGEDYSKTATEAYSETPGSMTKGEYDEGIEIKSSDVDYITEYEKAMKMQKEQTKKRKDNPKDRSQDLDKYKN